MIPFTYSNRYSFWRDAYQGGERFLTNNLERLSEEESATDYQKRIRTAPSPAAAQGIVNRVLAAFADRMRLCVRYGKLVDQLESGRGLDNLGDTPNQYVAELAKELALIGKVGVAVSTPQGLSVLANSTNAHPYCLTIRAENIRKTEPAPPGSPSIWGLVEWQTEDAKKVYRLTLESGKVYWQVEEKGKASEPTEIAGLTQIPFVLIQADSLMAKLAPHEVALTNLVSVLATNSPDLVSAFLARQNSSPFGAFDNPLVPLTIGRERGMMYGPKENVPTYVAPPAAPFAEARMLVDALVARMNDLVGISGDTEAERDQSVVSVAGNYGDALQAAEAQIWRHVAAYETETGVREVPVVKYPKWQSESEAERLERVDTLFSLAQKSSGRSGMELATVEATEQQYAGASSQTLQAAVDAVRNAPCLLNNATDVVRAFEGAAIDGETVADTLGCKPGIAAKAAAEKVQKARQLATLAMFSAQVKQADRVVGSTGSDREAELAAKRMSQVEGNGDTRGENL